jgi:hypothetical protein
MLQDFGVNKARLASSCWFTIALSFGFGLIVERHAVVARSSWANVVGLNAIIT